MAFWKEFAPAPSAIDTLLAELEDGPGRPGATLFGSSFEYSGLLVNTPSSSGSSTPRKAALSAAETLDKLMQTGHFLEEVRSGTHQRLNRFLTRRAVLERLLQWMMWGVGEGENVGDSVEDKTDHEADHPPEVEVDPIFSVNPTSGHSTPRSHRSVGEDSGLALPSRRRPSDESDTDDFEGPVSPYENFPQIAHEVLVSDIPGLSNLVFTPSEVVEGNVDDIPVCQPREFVASLWNATLSASPDLLALYYVQVGYWARVVNVLLDGNKGDLVFALSADIPNLLPRLLRLVPRCAPVGDVLLTLAKHARPPSPLIPGLVTDVAGLLAPGHPDGADGQMAAEELLKGIIDLYNLASTQMHSQQTQNILHMQQQLENVPEAYLDPREREGSGFSDAEWKDQVLVQVLAQGEMIQSLVSWALAEMKKVGEGEGNERKGDIKEEDQPEGEQENQQEDHHQHNNNATHPTSTSPPPLIPIFSVINDLIRKNNSNLVEQQMLMWAKHRETEIAHREMLSPENPVSDEDGGPSIVDFSDLLRAFSNRVPDIQKLLTHPHSSLRPVATTAGVMQPLTVERFKICELYAELLHCSNMALVNRPSDVVEDLFGQDGRLRNGYHDLERLAQLTTLTYESLAEGEKQGEEEKEEERDPFSDPGGEDEDGDVGSVFEGGEENKMEERLKEEEKEKSEAIEGAKNGENEKGDATHEEEPPQLTGEFFKFQILQHHVLENLLDLFFSFPLNNFLQNVVFDVVQQIFSAPLERKYNQLLLLRLLDEGQLVRRVLDEYRAAESETVQDRAYHANMGHLSLIVDEVLKLLDRCSESLYDKVSKTLPQPEWDEFVHKALPAIRDRNTTPLGGGLPMALSLGETAVAVSMAEGSSSDDSDEERGVGETEMVEVVIESDGEDDEEELRQASFSGQHGFGGLSFDPESGAVGEKIEFSRYLANTLTHDGPGSDSSSSEEEEEEVTWVEGSRSLEKPFDEEFKPTVENRRGHGRRRSNSIRGGEFSFTPAAPVASTSSEFQDGGDSDDDFGEFEMADLPEGEDVNGLGADPKDIQKATSSKGGEDVTHKGSFDSFDEDFSEFDVQRSFDPSEPSLSTSPPPQHNNMASLFSSRPNLFSFTSGVLSKGKKNSPKSFNAALPVESEPASISPVLGSPQSPSQSPNGRIILGPLSIDEGASLERRRSSSSDHGGIRRRRSSSSSGSDAVNRISPSQSSPTNHHTFGSPNATISMSPGKSKTSPIMVPLSPNLQYASLATSQESPLGPSVHSGAHLTEEGMVEADVEGVKVLVPADEIALSSRASAEVDQEMFRLDLGDEDDDDE